MREKLLIIGNGMASVRLCEEIVALCPHRFAITVVGGEARPGYNRVLLSAHLAGDMGEADLALQEAGWYRHHNITLLTGTNAASINIEARFVTLADERKLPFDRLVIATGSTPIMLTKPGMDLPGVMTFRDLGDVTLMRDLAARAAKVVVIGGGLLGLEAAYGLARCGASVTVLHLVDRLMERQLDAASARLLRAGIAGKGIAIELCADTAQILGTDCVTGVELADGRVLAAEAVVCAVGIRANAALARQAGIKVERGIVVDDHLQTSATGVYAIGECAQHRGSVYGLVEPAYQQAAALARHLAGVDEAAYLGTLSSTHLKVSGIGIFSCGEFMSSPASQTSVLDDKASGTYRKLVFSGNRLIGAVLVGDTTDALWYRDMIRSGADISSLRTMLIFGQDFVQSLPRQAA